MFFTPAQPLAVFQPEFDGARIWCDFLSVLVGVPQSAFVQRFCDLCVRFLAALLNGPTKIFVIVHPSLERAHINFVHVSQFLVGQPQQAIFVTSSMYSFLNGEGRPVRAMVLIFMTYGSVA